MKTLTARSVVYEETPSTLTGVRFFLVIGREIETEKKLALISEIENSISQNVIEKLSDWVELLQTAYETVKIPQTTSLSAGFCRHNIMYLKTVNSGKVYIKRKNNFTELIGGDNIATGEMEYGDKFAFIVDDLTRAVGGDSVLKNVMDTVDQSAVDRVITDLKSEREIYGSLVLAEFVYENKSEGENNYDDVTPTNIPQTNKLTWPAVFMGQVWERFALLNSSPQTVQKKKITLVVVFILLLILIWSVGLSYKRRQIADGRTKIEHTRELITNKLNDAEEAAFLSLPKALEFVTESKSELAALKKQINNKQFANELSELDAIITAEEGKLLKKENKSKEEFFDLTIDNKNTKGSQMVIDGDILAVLDSQGKTVYLLTIDKKALTKSVNSRIKDADLLAIYDGFAYIYVKGDGIYKLTGNEIKKIIENDKDWGNIQAFIVYSGNLYLMDTGRNTIYKYLVVDGGSYSEKKPYLNEGEVISLNGARSMTIDASLYVGFGDYAVKYTAGGRDSFKTVFPDNNIRIDKIFASNETDKVYGLDKKQGAIYILAKSGDYEKQINSDILTNAEDFIVYNNAAYVLTATKIFKIDLH